MTYEEKLRAVRRIGLVTSLAALCVLFEARDHEGHPLCMASIANNIVKVELIRRCAVVAVVMS